MLQSKETVTAAYVWRSTTASIESGTFSIVAATEVIAAVGLYWAFAIWLHSQRYIWISVIIAPLLLLRSDASVALGLRWFTQYVDRSFADVLRLPSGKFRSLRFWSSVLVALFAGMLSSYAIANVLLPEGSRWAYVIDGMVVGYCATQMALAVTVAVAAREVAAVAEARGPASIVAGLLVVAVGAATATSGAPLLSVLAAVVITSASSATAVAAAPTVLQTAMARTTQDGSTRVGGIDFGRAIIRAAPYSFATFVPGFLFGVLLRSVGIRFAATGCHLSSGRERLPDNWWRTLFSTDLFTPPELIPGYTRTDAFNVSHLRSRIRNYETLIGKFLYMLGFLILFVPAYLYRLSIKSTGWAYWPLVYISRPPKLANRPELIGDLLWSSPKERCRWVLLLATAVGLAAGVVTTPINIGSRVPPVLISPMEYMFLIDFSEIKPWQWCNIVSATITLLILICVMDFRIFVRHARNDATISSLVAKRARFLEMMRRTRNLVTWALFIIVFLHGVLWVWAMEKYLPEYILNLLDTLYGNAMPRFHRSA